MAEEKDRDLAVYFQPVRILYLAGAGEIPAVHEPDRRKLINMPPLRFNLDEKPRQS